MENPNCWQRAEWVVMGALQDYRELLKDEEYFGISQEKYICDKLRAEGLLNENAAGRSG